MWSLCDKKDNVYVEWMQRLLTERQSDLSHLTWSEKLRRLQLPCL